MDTIVKIIGTNRVTSSITENPRFVQDAPCTNTNIFDLITDPISFFPRSRHKKIELKETLQARPDPKMSQIFSYTNDGFYASHDGTDGNTLAFIMLYIVDPTISLVSDAFIKEVINKFKFDMAKNLVDKQLFRALGFSRRRTLSPEQMQINITGKNADQTMDDDTILYFSKLPKTTEFGIVYVDIPHETSTITSPPKSTENNEYVYIIKTRSEGVTKYKATAPLAHDMQNVLVHIFNTFGPKIDSARMATLKTNSVKQLAKYLMIDTRTKSKEELINTIVNMQGICV